VLRAATPERLSAFSDGVFAVLITVLVLELRPPELPTFKALLLLWPTWLSYAVSYLFIAIVWANHQPVGCVSSERLRGSPKQPHASAASRPPVFVNHCGVGLHSCVHPNAECSGKPLEIDSMGKTVD
jgi:Endosomal/lysosomal potassium channel TMEM175